MGRSPHTKKKEDAWSRLQGMQDQINLTGVFWCFPHWRKGLILVEALKSFIDGPYPPPRAY